MATEAKTKKKANKPEAVVKKRDNVIAKVKKRTAALLKRRPHRSFKLTRRRDYVRPLRMSGYWRFTHEVFAVLWKRKALFIMLAVLYAVLSAGLVGVASQSTYDELQDSFENENAGLFEGNWSEMGKAGYLLISGVTGSLNQTPTDVQRIFAALLGLLIWLTTIWLLRAIVAGKHPRLRDGLYNAGTPLVSTFFVSLIVVIQLLPIALAVLAFTAAASTGLIQGGVESMVFWMFAGLLGVLSLYWMVSTFLALVVVSLPGMYPMRAIRVGGDLVVGRRLKVILRFLWLLATLVVSWVVLLLPIIFFDKWLKGIWPLTEGWPLVPVSLLLVASLSVIWSAAYTYLFYRKVVDDDAAPA